MNIYKYVHAISYYCGNERQGNLKDALQRLKTHKLTSIDDLIHRPSLMLVCCIYDELTDSIKEKMQQICDLQNNTVHVKVIYRWNTGGTIQTMSDTYDCLINNNIKTSYIGVWEDDSIFKPGNIPLLDVVQHYLDEGYIYVGCLEYEDRQDITYTGNTKQFKKEWCNKRPSHQPCPWSKHCQIYRGSDSNVLIDDTLYKWTDGAVYITNMINLTKIKHTLIDFTLYPSERKHTHIESGINCGEVGFGTRLHINGLKMFGLPYNLYYEHLELKSIGNKLE